MSFFGEHFNSQEMASTLGMGVGKRLNAEGEVNC